MTTKPTEQLTTYQRTAVLQQASDESWGAITDERQSGDSVVFTFENGHKHAIRLLTEDDDHSGPERQPIYYTMTDAPDRPHVMGARPQPGDLDRLEADRQDGGMGVFDGS
jgi:hypothetical protein